MQTQATSNHEDAAEDSAKEAQKDSPPEHWELHHWRDRSAQLQRQLKMNAPGGLTSWSVQYESPVDNPGDNVRMEIRGKVIRFFCPINWPEAHKAGLHDFFLRASVNEQATAVKAAASRISGQVAHTLNKIDPLSQTV